jgi:hypothetical protein
MVRTSPKSKSVRQSTVLPANNVKKVVKNTKISKKTAPKLPKSLTWKNKGLKLVSQYIPPKTTTKKTLVKKPKK